MGEPAGIHMHMGRPTSSTSGTLGTVVAERHTAPSWLAPVVSIAANASTTSSRPTWVRRCSLSTRSQSSGARCSKRSSRVARSCPPYRDFLAWRIARPAFKAQNSNSGCTSLTRCTRAGSSLNSSSTSTIFGQMPQAWAERLLPSSRRLILRANSILAARAASRQGGEKTLDARPGPK